jgi:transcriptional regulator with XRE-family HTH domain
MDTAISYAARLRSLRALRGLTQLALARASGVAQALISRYEAGKLVPSERTQQALDQALGAPVAEHGPPPKVWPVEKLTDEQIVRRYQLLRRLERGCLRPGDREALPARPETWRRSPWLRRAYERGLLPPGPQWGGELGPAPQSDGEAALRRSS